MANCSDCHMAASTGNNGGHTFKIAGNYNGCNTTGCHGAAKLTATSSKVVDAKATTKQLLNDLASKLGDILHTEADAENNIYVGLTTNNYDGYLDFFDPTLNPNGKYKNIGNTSSWSQANKDINTSKPAFPSLKNIQLAALINFQLCLRESSLGIHNYRYSKALLKNSIEALTAAGI